MAPRRAATALLLVQLIALGGAAQQPAEFGRASGGEIVMTPKGAAPFSGSLELSLSSGGGSGRGISPGYGLTAGGTVIQDRLWVFGSASRQEVSQRFAALELPEHAVTGAAGGRLDARIAGGHDFSAFFEAARRPAFHATTPAAFAGTAPSSFLSLRHTGVVSSNMLFSIGLTRSSRTLPGLVPAE